MVDRIATKIETAFKEGGLLAGQAKYRTYFINTTLYLGYKVEVDNILTMDGYADCIVVA